MDEKQGKKATGTAQIVGAVVLLVWGVFVMLTGTVPLVGVGMIAVGVAVLLLGLNKRQAYLRG